MSVIIREIHNEYTGGEGVCSGQDIQNAKIITLYCNNILVEGKKCNELIDEMLITHTLHTYTTSTRKYTTISDAADSIYPLEKVRFKNDTRWHREIISIYVFIPIKSPKIEQLFDII